LSTFSSSAVPLLIDQGMLAIDFTIDDDWRFVEEGANFSCNVVDACKAFMLLAGVFIDWLGTVIQISKVLTGN
jgi:hypothetical protein